MVSKGEHALSHEEVLSAVLMLLLSRLTQHLGVQRASPAHNVPTKCFFYISACVREEDGVGVGVMGGVYSSKTLCGREAVTRFGIATRRKKNQTQEKHVLWVVLNRRLSRGSSELRSRAPAASTLVLCGSSKRQHQHGCGDGALGVSAPFF